MLRIFVIPTSWPKLVGLVPCQGPLLGGTNVYKGA